MSAVSGVASSGSPYDFDAGKAPANPAVTQTQPAYDDPDRDGDTDSPGKVEVKA